MLSYLYDIDFWWAEEAHAEYGSYSSGDKDTALPLEVIEPGRGGRAKGDEIAGERVGCLASMRMAGEHEIPVILAQLPAAFGVMREE